MADHDVKLFGVWNKMPGDECAAGYAGQVRFESNGLYFGTADPPGAFTWWDAGTWQTDAPAQLTLSTANDALVTYQYTLSGDTLTITDSAGCTFKYRRAT